MKQPLSPLQLREARKARGISAAHIARLLGVSPTHLHDMETGKRTMSADYAARYQEALK